MQAKRKRPAKAVTLLTKIEDLLADALKEFSVIEKSIEKNVRELLLSAEASISAAKNFIASSVETPAKPRPRPRAKAKRTVKARKLVRVA